MAKAWYSLSNTTQNTANDLMTLISQTSRRARINSVLYGGMGTTSAAGEIAVARSTGGTTPGGAQTPVLSSTDAPAASGAVVVDTTWAAQPTLSGSVFVRIPANANGGVVKTNVGMEFRNGEQVSIRPVVGTHNVTLTVEVEYDY